MVVGKIETIMGVIKVIEVHMYIAVMVVVVEVVVFIVKAVVVVVTKPV